MSLLKIFPGKRYGWSLTEVLLTILLIGITTGGIFFVMSASNRNTMNAYHLYLTDQLAKEPVEVLRCLGFNSVSRAIQTGIGEYRFNTWQSIGNSPESNIRKPDDTLFFERKITVEPLNSDETRGLLISVQVRPKTEIGISLKGRGKTEYSGIIIEQLP